MTIPSALPMPSNADPSESNRLPPNTVFDEFELTGVLGEGGFSVVYRAYDRLLGREVAIKEYMPSSIAFRAGDMSVKARTPSVAELYSKGLNDFVGEARTLARFDHPSLVKVYRVWRVNGTAYMVMPLYAGDTLKSVLKKSPGLSTEDWIKRLLGPLLDALEYVHGKDCLHRDIAPDNILMLESGRPLLLDFGAARHVIGDVTQALTVILKPGFAPPEQYAADSSIKQGTWTDVYALGALAWHCATGRAPAPSINRILRESIEPIEKLAPGRFSARFSAAVSRAMELRIEDRIQTIEEFRRELDIAETPDHDEPIKVTDSRTFLDFFPGLQTEESAHSASGGLPESEDLDATIHLPATSRKQEPAPLVVSPAAKLPAADAPEIAPKIPPEISLELASEQALEHAPALTSQPSTTGLAASVVPLTGAQPGA
jgi:serine/threonine protein kinase